MSQPSFDPEIIFTSTDRKLMASENIFLELVDYLNYLIAHDFDKLIFLLYRVDVSEKKLKEMLTQNQDTGRVIAQLIIDRQLQKIKTREAFNKSSGDISEEEKW